MKSFEGYLKQTAGDTYLLLAGGGIKPLSDFWTTTNPLGNSTGNYVLKIGDIMTGPLVITYPVSTYGSSCPFQIIATGSGSYQRALAISDTDMAAGSGVNIIWGKSDSSYNCAHATYHHVADGSTSNYGSLDIHGCGEIINWLGNGTVGIGTKSPTTRLEVNGDIKCDHIKFISWPASYRNDSPNCVATYVNNDSSQGITWSMTDNLTVGKANYITLHYVANPDNCRPPAGDMVGFYRIAGGYGNPGADGHIITFNWTDTTTYGAQMYIDTDPTQTMAIRSKAGGGGWTGWRTLAGTDQLSDMRKKRDIRRISNLLPLYEFRMINDNRKQYGVIALELELMGLFELVNTNANLKFVYYLPTLSYFLAKLSNIVEDNNINTNNRINLLEKRILDLELENQDLRKRLNN